MTSSSQQFTKMFSVVIICAFAVVRIIIRINYLIRFFIIQNFFGLFIVYRMPFICLDWLGETVEPILELELTRFCKCVNSALFHRIIHRIEAIIEYY